MAKEFDPVFGISYKWIAAIIVMIGTFMTLLDTTIVDITIPKMLAALNTDTYGIQWVIIAYMIGSAVAMTAVGWLGAATSYRFVYMLGMVIFLTMSVICGQATSLTEMLIGRLIQGIGEGLIVPISMTILFLVFPKEEAGLAMGIYGLGASFAPALGPTIGGFLTEHLSWRWIFYVNVPVGLIGFLLALILLEDVKPEDEKAWPFDWVGFILLAIFLGSLITFITKGQDKGWLQSYFIITLIAISVCSLIAFLIWEHYQHYPVLDLSLFKDPIFTIGVVTLGIFSLTLYGIFYLMPLYMERLRLYPTLLSGLIMLPGSIAMGISLIIGGVLSDRIGVRPIAIICMIFYIIFSYLLSIFDLYTPKSIVLIMFVLWCIPAGPLFPTLTTGSLQNVEDKKVNMGSSIQNVTRLVCGSIGTAIATTILERRASYFFDMLSAHTNYGHMPFLLAWQKAVKGFVAKGACLSFAREQANALMDFYIKAHSYFIAYQASFKILALLALMGLPILFFFKVEKGSKKHIAI